MPHRLAGQAGNVNTARSIPPAGGRAPAARAVGRRGYTWTARLACVGTPPGNRAAPGTSSAGAFRRWPNSWAARTPTVASKTVPYDTREDRRFCRQPPTDLRREALGNDRQRRHIWWSGGFDEGPGWQPACEPTTNVPEALAPEARGVDCSGQPSASRFGRQWRQGGFPRTLPS